MAGVQSDCCACGERLARWLAAATAVCALPLMFSGGSVTSYGVGMAVPDWPTTFGENMITYNFLDASFGVKVEHGHRLLGMTVGLLGMASFAATLIWSTERSAKIAVAAAFAMICIQGVLGGMRVSFNKAGWGTELAIVHGVFGQAVFSVLALAAAILGGRPRPHEAELDSGVVRWIGYSLPALWLMQTASGALVRHTGHLFVVHAISAGVFTVGVLAVAIPLLADGKVRRFLGPLAGALLALVVLQALLGVGAMLSTGLIPPSWRTAAPSHTEAMTRTAHQFVSALIGAATLLAARGLYSMPHVAPALRDGRGMTLEIGG